MAQITKEIRVDVSQPNVFQAIVAKQLDCNSRFLKITLVDFGVKVEVPNTAKVTINANRPDGKSDSFMGVANNDGTITVPLTQWMLEVAGLLKCDVSVINTTDNKKLTSTDFFVNVQEAANKNNTISENPDGEIRVITPVNLINENSTDDQYPSAKAVYDLDNITATATGKAITINPANAPLPQLILRGETTQEVAPNTNVLPYPFTSSTQTVKGVTFTDNGDGSITISGTNSSGNANVTITSNAKLNNVVVGTKYRIQSGATLDSSLTYQVRVVTPNSTQNLIDGDEFEADSTDVTVSIVFQIILGTTYDLTITPKIVVTECDPISVGDSGSYSVDLYGGKNFFDINGNVNVLGNSKEQTSLNSVSGNILTTNANGDTINGVGQKIKVKVGVPITFSAKVLSFGTGVGVGLFIYENGKYVKFYMSEVVNETCKVTFTATVEEPIFAFVTKSGTGGQVTDIQVEYGTEVTPYEPCNKQSITFTDIMRGVGEVADDRNFAKGVKTQRFGIVDLGTLNWVYYEAENFFYAWISNIKMQTPEKQTAGLCGKYPCVSQLEWFKQDKVICPFWSIIPSVINLKDGTYTDVETLKAALSGTMYVYELETPIETPLTETELNAYRQLYTNQGNTTILSEAEMGVDYYINKPNAQAIGNIHSQVNKDYFKLSQAIISLGGN